MEELCARFLEAWEADRIDKLVLIPMFILDFLCIHPFNDGNGRMSRLLTLLLFYKAGYIVGKYISMEMLIEKTKETYYEALQASSTGWHEGENSYEPFVKYYLGIMLKAYNEFESRVEHLKHRSLSKPDRIKAVMSRPRQHRHLKRKNSILFLVFLDFPHFFIHSGWQDTLF